MMPARLLLGVAAVTLAGPACAKPASPARDYPAIVSVATTPSGAVYADGKHKTLYALSLRAAFSRWGPGKDFCNTSCRQVWTPLIASADAKPVGLWSVVDSAQGRMWAYDRNPVFTFNADAKAGDRTGDGYDDLWTAIAYVPPAPILIAPPNVAAKLVEGGYVLADTQGHALTTECASDCTPFAAGMASLPIGSWTVLRDRETPQWAWRGKAVFLTRDESLSTSAGVLRP